MWFLHAVLGMPAAEVAEVLRWPVDEVLFVLRRVHPELTTRRLAPAETAMLLGVACCGGEGTGLCCLAELRRVVREDHFEWRAVDALPGAHP
ncbi:MAG: hypothetical protein ACOZNI_20115 [Myxococcota bacterium]